LKLILKKEPNKNKEFEYFVHFIVFIEMLITNKYSYSGKFHRWYYFKELFTQKIKIDFE